MVVAGDGVERDLEARLRLGAASPTASGAIGIPFRAPQEQFTVDDFELGKIYGVGSYSKVVRLRAKKKDTGEVYALKIMDKMFIAKPPK